MGRRLLAAVCETYVAIVPCSYSAVRYFGTVVTEGRDVSYTSDLDSVKGTAGSHSVGVHRVGWYLGGTNGYR